MLSALVSWARTLLAVAVFGMLLELLLPSRSMQPYVRLAVGLVVLAAVLSPLVGLVRSITHHPMVAFSMVAPRDWRREEARFQTTLGNETANWAARQAALRAQAAACDIPSVHQCLVRVRAERKATGFRAAAIWACATTSVPEREIVTAIARAVAISPKDVGVHLRLEKGGHCG